WSSPLVWAPPVLTTTPGGAADVVDPVDVDVVLAGESPAAGSVAGGAWFAADSVGSGADVPSGSEADSDDGSDEGVSAHATPGDPVITAAPTPRATANPPTRPTYAAAFTMVSRSAQQSRVSGNGFTTFALLVVSEWTTSAVARQLLSC
ncbi:MAG TPA: hypothetical protein VJ777_28220, partial [Mycobacterium sp.]|nr:hypothetical protein [Mycobacterium sp.]